MRVETVRRIELSRDIIRRFLQIALRADAQRPDVQIEVEYLLLRIHVAIKRRLNAFPSRKNPHEFDFRVRKSDFLARFAEIPVSDYTQSDFFIFHISPAPILPVAHIEIG